MRIVLKHKFVFIVFFLITVLSLMAHFWNYKTLVNFHLDPPLFMQDVKDMVDSGKVRLVGSPVVSKEVMGREFFTGPFHYYVLAVLGIISQWNIVVMSAFFTLLWIVGPILIFLWLNKKFGGLIALLIYALISFYPPFLALSRQMWNPHYLPVFRECQSLHHL